MHRQRVAEEKTIRVIQGLYAKSSQAKFWLTTLSISLSLLAPPPLSLSLSPSLQWINMADGEKNVTVILLRHTLANNILAWTLKSFSRSSTSNLFPFSSSTLETLCNTSSFFLPCTSEKNSIADNKNNNKQWKPTHIFMCIRDVGKLLCSSECRKTNLLYIGWMCR